MDLLRSIDVYCERVDASYWSEPVNALTNLAFILAALWVWPRTAGFVGARLLTILLFTIGVGSWLFHTHGQIWALIADVTPIALFVLTFFYLLHRDVLDFSRLLSFCATLAFIPYAALTVALWEMVPFYGQSAVYMPIPTLLLIYALVLLRRRPSLARGLLIGAAILMTSLTARAFDPVICDDFPLGTHFLWHVFNGVMLAWMILLTCRERRTGPTPA